MPRRVLITGITGFAGSHLAELLLASGDEVHGLAHEPQPHPHLAAIADRLHLHEGDIRDVESVGSVVAAARPEVVFHLAGQAVPMIAAADPAAAISVNVLGTANVSAALRHAAGVRVVAASSAEVYGSPDRIPVSEDAPLRPTNVYAATKVAAEAVLRELGAGGVGVTILRPANQNGPRQHPGLAASAFAKQIAEAEAGLSEAVIRHGSLEARRDFLDVRDMAEAYAAAADLDLRETTVFNVGSGRAVAISELLTILVSLARVPLHTEMDPERVRGVATPVLVLDASRFRARTGWGPRIPLERSLSDTLDHWRRVVGGELASPVAAMPTRGGS